MQTSANDNATATPALDLVADVLGATLPPALAWSLAWWAEHVREARHARHAANSWAKHHAKFGTLRDHAHALVVARCVDFGMRAAAVPVLLEARRRAREERLGRRAA